MKLKLGLSLVALHLFTSSGASAFACGDAIRTKDAWVRANHILVAQIESRTDDTFRPGTCRYRIKRDLLGREFPSEAIGSCFYEADNVHVEGERNAAVGDWFLLATEEILKVHGETYLWMTYCRPITPLRDPNITQVPDW